MIDRNKPHFIIKRNLQKSLTTGVYFSDVITPDVLKDVCVRITNINEYTVDFVDNDYEDEFLKATYNQGRMAILQYKDEVSYISFCEKKIEGRNSGTQSVPTAFNLFYSNAYPKKKLYYYFIPHEGNAETDYYIFMYRLMKTVGFIFLNEETLTRPIYAFCSIEDIILARNENAGRNSSNNSTYITKNGSLEIEIYGKTYGANKYETSLMCYVLSVLANVNHTITLYEVPDNDLKHLPQSSIDVIDKMGIIKNRILSSRQLEKNTFEEDNSLRSPRYIFNLLEKRGAKKCTMCDCDVPEIIQGAHIWPVSSIKKRDNLTLDQKIDYAIDGENGIWLCENHHKLFDQNIIQITREGKVQYFCDNRFLAYLEKITTIKEIPSDFMTDHFVEYLDARNAEI